MISSDSDNSHSNGQRRQYEALFITGIEVTFSVITHYYYAEKWVRRVTGTIFEDIWRKDMERTAQGS